jgi:XRE family transcriptional regulator, fatty acid utilization regulator
MKSSKIFAGHRLRRLRQKLGLSQGALAQSLGLSASYLNLMERDQRPLTAQVLLKLSSLEGVDIASLAEAGEASALLPSLREMLADPLLVGEVPPGNEAQEMLAAAPNMAGATLKLYAAYREAQRRLADAARGLPLAVSDGGARDWLASHPLTAAEDLAEDIWSELAPKDDIFAGLKARLRATVGIDTRILPVHLMGEDRALHDRHAQRLNLSERLGQEQRVFETSHLVARLEGQALSQELVASSPFSGKPDDTRLIRSWVTARLALAVTAPRGRFLAAAEELKWDIEALGRRFTLEPHHVIHRLAQLNKNASALSVSSTGAVLRRQGALPFHISRDAPLCGQLSLFDEGLGLLVAGLAPTEGGPFTAIAWRDVAAVHGLFLPADAFAETGYNTPLTPRPHGPTCRLCDIRNCRLRSDAPALRPPGLNDYRRATTEFEPV